MVMLKSCPRCATGDVILDRDMYGHNVQCLQCGYMKDLEEGSQLDAFLSQLRHKAYANLGKAISAAAGKLPPNSALIG